METVIVDRTPQGIPVHFDRHAFECDHVIVAGRVKPHTGFVGEIESGLHKMMLIGLGKHEGAKIYHRAILDYSFREIIHAVADVVLEKVQGAVRRGDRRERLRPDGPDRSRAAGEVLRTREGTAGTGHAVDAPPAVQGDRPVDRR